MANLHSIARPYALAAFEYASEHQQLPTWKAFLEAAAYMAVQPQMTSLFATNELSTSNWFALFSEVLATILSAEQKNLLLLLAQNKRLSVLPEITALYNAYYAALEKTSEVRIITAIPMALSLKEKLSQALTKRIQQAIALECEVDPAILGGAIIHLGRDKVIDGSVRGKLTRLREALTG